MRLLFIGGDRPVTENPFWSVIARTPGLSAIFHGRVVPDNSPEALLRRQLRNVQRHGWRWIPYRIAELWRARRAMPFLAHAMLPAPFVEVELLAARNLHHPRVLQRIAEWKPDLGLSIGAPIMKRELFGIPPRGMLNLHLGKAPDFRGAPPGFWELYTGATEVGATVHWVDDGLDTGPIVAQATAPIFPTDRLADVERRLFELGRGVLRQALAEGASPTMPRLPQRPGGRTYRFPTVAQRWELERRLAERPGVPSVVTRPDGSPARGVFEVLSSLRRGEDVTDPWAFECWLAERVRAHQVPPIAFNSMCACVYKHAWPLLQPLGLSAEFLHMHGEAAAGHDTLTCRPLMPLEIETLVGSGWRIPDPAACP